jgi:curved DNA-binding protein CbpA
LKKMDDHDDPYEILGVSKDATEAEIKKAYKKMALKHHPDKQSTEEGRIEATTVFAKISNAYEILGDSTQRGNYDREAARGGAHANRPWAKMPRRSRNSNNNNNSGQDDFFHHTPFHDPFSVFESFFRGEGFGDDFFANPFGHMHQQQRGSTNMRGQGPFQDSFFSGGGGSMFNDPFFGGGGMGGFGNDPFFGGGMMMRSPMMMGGGNLFSAMNQMNNMMNPPQQQQGNPFAGRLPQGQSFVYSSTTSTNLGGNDRGGSVSVSTTTRIVNGRREVVTERIVQKADGTVERHVVQSGDDDLPAPTQRRLEGGISSPRQALPPPPPEAAPRRNSPASKGRKPKSERSLFKRKRRDSSKSDP